MVFWSGGGQLLYCCQLCLPWCLYDYAVVDAQEYVNLSRYIVPSPSEHELMVDKEPTRNVQQHVWSWLRISADALKDKTARTTPDLVSWIHRLDVLIMYARRNLSP